MTVKNLAKLNFWRKVFIKSLTPVADGNLVLQVQVHVLLKEHGWCVEVSRHRRRRVVWGATSPSPSRSGHFSFLPAYRLLVVALCGIDELRWWQRLKCLRIATSDNNAAVQGRPGRADGGRGIVGEVFGRLVHHEQVVAWKWTRRTPLGRSIEALSWNRF